jgi:choline dehydrogenase-like flavoprotein
MTDYLIVGGGLAGCVLASRLKEYDASINITVVETGPNEHENPLITEPMGTMQLNGSQYQYNYRSVPQKPYDGRQVFQAGGKVLSGSSAV